MDGDTPNLMKALCLTCGVDMWPCQARRMFCSQRCRNLYFRAIEREARDQANADRTCKACGKPIDVRRPSTARYCNDACRMSLGPNLYTAWRMCMACGKPFRGRSKTQKVCCRQCWKDLVRKKSRTD